MNDILLIANLILKTNGLNGFEVNQQFYKP